MRSRFHFGWLIATILQLCWLAPTLADDTDWVQVIPEQTDEILRNPGMGWETFHRTSAADGNLPAWIPSTVHYARWGWGQLEPVRGQIDYGFLDAVLKETRESGQMLAFRVMCCSSYPRQPYHPKWLSEIGGKVVMTRYGDGPELEVPVLDDPEVLAAHLDFIRAARRSIRWSPGYRPRRSRHGWLVGRVAHESVDPTRRCRRSETQKKIVDAYLAAFQKTPLLMLVNGGEMLRICRRTKVPAGEQILWATWAVFWRKWSHMRNGYPTWLSKANALDAWKHGAGCMGNRRGHATVGVFQDSRCGLFSITPWLCTGQSSTTSRHRCQKDPKVRAEVERFLAAAWLSAGSERNEASEEDRSRAKRSNW